MSRASAPAATGGAGLDAFAVVNAHLRSSLPPSVPPSYQKIIWAEQTTKGRCPVWQALLLMFDGGPGRVEVFRSKRDPELWSHRWTDLPGGHCSYEGGRWIRINPETLEPYPPQSDLFASAALRPSTPTPDAPAGPRGDGTSRDGGAP